ncbi:MAG: phenylalanine 4-monooxygenase [Phycisphaeraceae bacterium]|nr:MAG: phenylalanine 4-monooxygenase [Phycisphaeraceae bacterium]
MRADIRYNNIIDSDEARIAQAAADAAAALPHTEIDADRFYITQRYDLYTRENHDVWREMYLKRWEVLEKQVSRQFIEGMKILRLTGDRIPLLDDLVLERDIEVAGGVVIRAGTRLDGINKFLKAQSDWASYGVPGYLPAKSFFACLAQREFPTTVLIRPREVMDYLPEPDIFHDVFGHVPLHTLRVFADFLQTYGGAALLCDDEGHVKRLARLFWFTVEFGLIEEDGRIKVYGSGLVSSHAESEYALSGRWEERGEKVEDCTARPVPVYRPFDLERVCRTDFEIDHFQPIYYVLESFEQLRDAMSRYAEEVIGSSGLAAAGKR